MPRRRSSIATAARKKGCEALLLLSSLVMSACVIQAPTRPRPRPRLEPRAAFDLGCPEAQIEFMAIDPSTYGARGCGRQGTYLWVCPTGADCRWVLNGTLSVAPAPSANP